jgi:hypothetical protein
MGTYCDCGEKLNDDYADWDREICGYCVLKEKLEVSYPLCLYCQESYGKEDCDNCIQDHKNREENTKSFREKMKGRTCYDCNQKITHEQIMEQDAMYVSSSKNGTRYYHSSCYYVYGD